MQNSNYSFHKTVELSIDGKTSCNIYKLYNLPSYTFEEASMLLKNKKRYKRLEEADKFGVLQAIADDITKELGLPRILLAVLSPSLDQYQQTLRAVALNNNLIAITIFEVPKYAIRSIAHEIRHLYQCLCYETNPRNKNLSNIFCSQILDDNPISDFQSLDNVQKAVRNAKVCEAYRTHPLEVDARLFAEQYSKRKKLPFISDERKLLISTKKYRKQAHRMQKKAKETLTDFDFLINESQRKITDAYDELLQGGLHTNPLISQKYQTDTMIIGRFMDKNGEKEQIVSTLLPADADESKDVKKNTNSDVKPNWDVINAFVSDVGNTEVSEENHVRKL